MTLRGSCLCGGVAFEVEGDALQVNHCHCSRCRKARGTAHATNAAFPIAAVRFVRGAELLSTFKVPEAKHFTHTFCKVCGSSLPFMDAGRSIAIVPVGVFDDDPAIKPQRHIWVSSKAAWEEITDDLPQLPSGPPPR